MADSVPLETDPPFKRKQDLKAQIERSVTGGSVEGDSRRLVGPAARGEVVWPIDRDRASSYAQSGGARRGTHLT